jgi:phosphoglycerate dehydrogenase-like enzyme
MKAVLHYRASPGFRRRLAELDAQGLRTSVVDKDDVAGLAREMRDAAILLHVITPVTTAMIAASPALRLIQKIGVGVNTIDLDAAQQRGIAVCNMPGTNTQAVAEATLLLMLATLRQVAALDRRTREGAGWQLDPALVDGLGEMSGRIVGLVGFGNVAQRLAPVLQALGATVVYAARSPRPDGAYACLTLDEVLETADIVSLHLPLTADTQHLIDAAALARMKPGAILVNTARGGLVDEAALLAALDGGRLRGAGLDVFAQEPTAADNPLLRHGRTVLMPHLAWLTPETLGRSLVVVAENFRRLRDGETLLHRVI